MTLSTPKILSFHLFLFTFLLCFQSNAQKIGTFQMSMGGSSDDIGSGLLALPDKGFILAGMTKSYGAGGADIMLVRTDSLGRKIWAKTYGGTSDEGTGMVIFACSIDIILSPDSNIIVCSSTKSYGSGGADVYFLKIDLNGNVKWANTYGGKSDDFGMSVLNDPNGGYIIAGETFSYGAGAGDALLIKTDSGGKVIWANAYGNSSNEEAAWKINKSVDGNFLVSGYSNISGSAYNEMVMKVDDNGKLLMGKVYGTSQYDGGQSVIDIPSDSSIYLTGFTYNIYNSANTVSTLCKMNKSGKLIWCKIYDKTQHSGLGTILWDNNKKVFNCKTSDIQNSQQRVGMMRIDTSGKIIYTKTYGPYSTSSSYTGGLGGHEILPLSNGGFAMEYATNAFGFGGWNYFFAKLDSGGGSNSCNVQSLSMSPFNFTSNFSDYSYAFSSGSISMGLSNGVQVNNIQLKDSVVCTPFSSGFRWLNACSSNTVQFADSTFYNPVKWKWNFGDSASSSNISANRNPSHTFSKPGIYIVKLVSGNGSYTDSISQIVAVNANVTAGFSVNSRECFNQQRFAFTNNSSSNASLTYNWNFGDSSGTSVSNPVHVYKYPGTYTVTLISASAGGCGDTVTKKVEVLASPSASIQASGNTTFCNGQSVVLFTNSSAGINYQWLNGGKAISGQTKTSYTASTSGNYQIVASNDSGCTDTSTALNVKVNPIPAKPVISISGRTLKTGTAATYQWYINDSVVIKGANSGSYTPDTSHGTYSVSITDSNGCSNTSDPYEYDVSGIEPASITDHLRIYPVPAHDRLYIEFEGGNTKFQTVDLLDVNGKSIEMELTPYTSPALMLSVKNLPKGIYILKLAGKDSVVIRKIALD